MTKHIIAISLAFFFCNLTFAQTSFGFRAGLNFNQIKGELQTGESFASNTGFHIGAAFSRNFTDIWGIRGEFVYSQKGGQSNFEGDSYLFLNKSDRKITHLGTRNMTIATSNAYIDLPITTYARITNWLELSAGIAPGFLVNSRATGDLKFTSSALASPVSMTLFYRYYNDQAGEAAEDATTQTVKEKATANDLTYPSSIGAYYFQETKDKNLYKVFDLNAIFGVSFYFNKGLYLGTRLQYGLIDITNNEADFSLSENVTRSDKDINIIYQASVGFNF